ERVVEGLELLLIGLCDARESALALVRQRHQGPPAIDGIFLALQQAAVHTALDQERGAVVAELQPLGDLANAHGRIRRVATHDEQQHVLLRRDATRTSLLLRIAQEAPDGVAKVGVVTVIRVAEQVGLRLVHWRTTSSSAYTDQRITST